MPTQTNTTPRLTIVNPIFKDTVTFLKTAAETGGKLTEMEVGLMPGGSNPLHYHKSYAEKFTAIDGNLGLQLGKRKIILQSGEFYTVQIREVHRFYNPMKQKITFRIECMPGHIGAENMLKMMYGLARDGKTNQKGILKSMAALALISGMGDSNLLGFFTWIAPLLRSIAAKARNKGLEKQLLDSYCRDEG